MNWFTILREHLTDPEYLHVLLNPLPVYGLAIATLGLVLALILRNQRVTIAALVLVFVSALSAWPTYHYGEAGYDRVKALSDPAGEQWLDEHMARGEKLIWAFYVLAGVAAIGIGAVVKWPRTSLAISVLTLALGSTTLGIGGYIAYAGGHVRHREFRFEPPPEGHKEEHHHAGEDATHKEHAESQSATPMDHGSMPGMEPSKSPVRESEAPTQDQLEASRLQLEASRKQLEATNAAKRKDASPTPSAMSPPHAEDGHTHQPKP